MHVAVHPHAVDNERLILDRGLESLLAVPGHIPDRCESYAKARHRRCSLDGDPRTFGDQDEVLFDIVRAMRRTHDIITLTASPCTIATRSLFSMTLGSTLSVDATL